MKISILDGSNYFRGLLLLIGKDHTISETESEMMKNLGRALGLEREFCEEAIRDILDNRYISDTPPEFSNKELARMFVRDGFTIATADHEMHALEVEWLRSTAEANGLDDAWFGEQKTDATRPRADRRLEAYGLQVQYHG